MWRIAWGEEAEELRSEALEGMLLRRTVTPPVALANGQELLPTPSSAPDPSQTPTTQVLLQPEAPSQEQRNNEARNIFRGSSEYDLHFMRMPSSMS